MRKTKLFITCHGLKDLVRKGEQYIVLSGSAERDDFENVHMNLDFSTMNAKREVTMLGTVHIRGYHNIGIDFNERSFDLFVGKYIGMAQLLYMVQNTIAQIQNEQKEKAYDEVVIIY